MRKLFTVLGLFTALMYSGNVNAQEFQEGDKVLNLTLGLGNAIYSGSGYNSLIPPVAASLEVCLKDNVLDENGSVGVGGYAGFAFSRYRYRYSSTTWGYNYTNIVIGPRAAFHYKFIDNLDTYAGVMAGANIAISSAVGSADPDYVASRGGIRFDFYLGGRYYFNERIAGLAELGMGVSYLNFGVAIKM